MACFYRSSPDETRSLHKAMIDVKVDGAANPFESKARSPMWVALDIAVRANSGLGKPISKDPARGRRMRRKSEEAAPKTVPPVLTTVEQG
jgi:hypothetical protein